MTGNTSAGNDLFDLGEQYADMLNRGISLSGEDQLFFIRNRVADMCGRLPREFTPRRILDFGCGIGVATEYLASTFPNAEVAGVDTAAKAISYARDRHAGPRLRYETLDWLDGAGDFDLCYCNGVFHHIPPAARANAVALVYRALLPGGYFALFENNPLNVGTRMVMKRIPFDRDAVTLYPWELVKLLSQAGFHVSSVRSLFYFPRALAMLRFTEPYLARLPLGAQYYALAKKPSAR